MAANASTDLIYAILAMDSYNRGYGSGVTDLNLGDRIGKWSILTDAEAELESSAFDNGFYAIAFTNSQTKGVVASFRGTDAPFLDDDQRGASDPHTGYGLAFGLPGEGRVEFNVFGQNLVLLADQARLAEQPLACRH